MAYFSGQGRVFIGARDTNGNPLGLTFVGRGFSVRVGVPFDESLDQALRSVAAACIEACPTGALAFVAGDRRE